MSSNLSNYVSVFLLSKIMTSTSDIILPLDKAPNVGSDTDSKVTAIAFPVISYRPAKKGCINAKREVHVVG